MGETLGTAMLRQPWSLPRRIGQDGAAPLNDCDRIIHAKDLQLHELVMMGET